MNQIANELGTEKISKLLLKQAIPASIGILVMSLNMIVDTIFVGQWIGVMAIAAITCLQCSDFYVVLIYTKNNEISPSIPKLVMSIIS